MDVAAITDVQKRFKVISDYSVRVAQLMGGVTQYYSTPTYSLTPKKK